MSIRSRDLAFFAFGALFTLAGIVTLTLTSIDSGSSWVEVYEPVVRQEVIAQLRQSGIDIEVHGDRISYPHRNSSEALSIYNRAIASAPQPYSIPDPKYFSDFKAALVGANVPYVIIPESEHDTVYVPPEHQEAARRLFHKAIGVTNDSN